MYNRLAEMLMEHQHSDGSWGTFERSHHDVAEHDPERAWVKGEIYSCTTCDEKIRISDPNEKPGESAG